MSSLTRVPRRIAAVGAVIVLLLLAGVWVIMTHSPARGAAADGAGATPSARASTKPAVPLQLVSATPASATTGVNGAAPIQLKFSVPVAVGSPLPTIRPHVRGTWQGAGTKVLEFVPAAAFHQYAHVSVTIPGGPQGIKSVHGGLLAQTQVVRFRVGHFQTARLDQLLAQLGYLPLTWAPAPGVTVPAATDRLGQLGAAYSPPQGSFSWQPGYPAQLRTFWQGGSTSGEIIKGAVMAFESNHGMTMDGIAGPRVWAALLHAVAANQQNPSGYTYAIARESNPETLTIWHDGQRVLHVLANTGIPVAPTTIGTAPVYLRYRNQIMRGTNPDGTKYADPVQFVAYFRGGEAVHYFPRGSYGYPQSLGCVELDLTDAAKAWPYLTYGSLVTVDRGALTPASSPVAN